MTEFKEEQLLFCVERGPMVGVLHFVDFATLETEDPQLSSCMVKKAWLKDFVPGGLYRLEVKNGNLVQYIKEREFMITQPYFVMLMERKHVYYDGQDSPFVPQQYYTFSDYRALMLYRPQAAQRALIWLCRGGLSLLAVLLPLALLTLFGFRAWQSGAGADAPVTVLAALPLTVWAIVALGAAVREILLRWSYTRYQSMQDACLLSGGKRSPIGLPRRRRNALILSGAICLLVLVVTLLVLRL